jgi:hypothetical protein
MEANKKNSNFILPKVDTLMIIFYKHRILIALLSAILLLTTSCKKTIIDSLSESTLRQYFDEQILNKNFIVELATDTSINKTSNFSGYTFILSRTTSFIDGPMVAFKATDTIKGTWASSEDYGFLTINLNTPVPPNNFAFINRKWKFVKKDLPVMQLAPYGTTDPKVLHMRRL